MRIYPAAIPLFLILMSSNPLRAQQVHGFPTLQQGTPVALQLDETLSGARARIGQRVAFEVLSDVTVQDQVIIPAGSSALGTVAQVVRHGWAGHTWHEGAGRLDVNIDAVRLPSGQIVPLSITADGNVSSDGEPIATKRRDLLVPEGTVLRAYVRRDTIIVQQTASVSN